MSRPRPHVQPTQPLRGLAPDQGLLFKQSGNLFQEGGDAPARFQGCVYRGMSLSVGVHYQHAGPLVRLLDHVGQVVTVILGQGWAQDYQVKRIPFQGFLDLLAALRLGHVVSRAFNGKRLHSKDFRITFSVKNLQFGRRF